MHIISTLRIKTCKISTYYGVKKVFANFWQDTLVGTSMSPGVVYMHSDGGKTKNS